MPVFAQPLVVKSPVAAAMSAAFVSAARLARSGESYRRGERAGEVRVGLMASP